MAPDHHVSQFDRPSSVERLFLGLLQPSGSCDLDELEALCAKRPELAVELRALADRHARGRALFQEPARAPGGRAEPVSLCFRERYEVQGEIARGGMGVVLEVWDAKLRRKLAMKCLRGDRDARDPLLAVQLERRRARLVNEAQVLAQLEHPGIVPVHDVGLDEQGELYFTMLRVRGESLDRVFAAVRERRDGWSLTRALSVLLRVSEAVAYAHQKGVLHRDLKPSNVMVGAFGEAYVMDWGLARASAAERGEPISSGGERAAAAPPSQAAHGPGESFVRTNRSDERQSDSSSPLLTQEGEVVGTPAYMSPEQARGRVEEIDPRSDVYSLGAMLYELLAGSAPYATELRESPPHAVLAAALERAPLPVDRVAPKTPPELVAICSKAMARERGHRYGSVADLADDLRAYLEGRVVKAHRTGAMVELRKWILRNKGAAAAIAAVIVGLGATATVQALLKRDVQRAQLESEARAEDLRKQNYFNSVALAAAALKEGKSGRMRELLDACPADLRGWEWRFLDARVDTSERLIRLPPQRTRPLAFTADGCSLIAGAACSTCEILVLDPDGAQPAVTLESCGSYSLSISADGTNLVALAGGPRALRWDTRTWTRLPDTRLGIDENWPAVVCDPVDARFAISGPNPVEIRDVRTGALCALLETGQSRTSVSWSHDGARIFIGGDDGSITVWDSRDGTLLQRTAEERTQVGVLASPDGRWLVGANSEHLTVYDLPSMAVAHRRDAVGGLGSAWSPDSSWLAIIEETTIRLLDAGSWTRGVTLNGHNDTICCAAFAPDSSRIASASFDGEVRIWDLGRAHDRPVSRVTDFAAPLRFSRDGQWLAVPRSTTPPVVEIWSMPERRCVRTLELARGSGLADVTPDLSRVLARAGPGPVMVDARGGRELANITGVPGNYSHFNADCTRFSPDGSRISVVGSDGSLGVWNAATLQREWSVRAYAGPDVWPGRLLGGCWSPDGRWIATLPADLRAQVWNAENGELVREWHVRGSGSQQALFSRDSRCLFVSGGTVNGLECWDVESGACLWSFPKDFATSLHLDSEGRRLFCLRSGATAVRDAGTGVLITSLELDPTLAYGFSVSPVDDTLVTATPQGLRFWDTSRPR